MEADSPSPGDMVGRLLGGGGAVGLGAGVYAGLVTLGLVRGAVRPCTQMLWDTLKLCALGVAATLTLWPPLALVVMATAVFCLHSNLPSPRLPALGRAIFVTGCDRGLGHQLAVHLDSVGATVFAGCLYPGGEGEAALRAACSDRLTTVALDVSDPASVATAAQQVKDRLQGRGLWGVVNNAGVLFIGCLEVTSAEDVARMVNTNLMGQIHVTRAFLPLLRHSRGRLVNVASNTGLAPAPFHAAYCASKAGVAALTECLRLELAPLGISVSTIIPSGYRTGIMLYDYRSVGDRWLAAADEEVRQSYGRECFYPENKTKDVASMLNPDFGGITGAMTDALLEVRPKAFYYRGFLARSLPWLYAHTPAPIASLFYPPLVTWFKFDPPCLSANKRS